MNLNVNGRNCSITTICFERLGVKERAHGWTLVGVQRRRRIRRDEALIVSLFLSHLRTGVVLQSEGSFQSVRRLQPSGYLVGREDVQPLGRGDLMEEDSY